MELNPNHKVTQDIHDHWHKIAALLMSKFGKDHVIITMDDIDNLIGSSIVIEEKNNELHLSIVDKKTAIELVKKEGGLPC